MGPERSSAQGLRGTIIMRVKNRSIKDISIKPPTGKRVSVAQMNR
jgi:hypothetical protein